MIKGNTVKLLRHGMWTRDDGLEVKEEYTIEKVHAIESGNIRVSPAKKGLWHRMDLFQRV